MSELKEAIDELLEEVKQMRKIYNEIKDNARMVVELYKKQNPKRKRTETNEKKEKAKKPKTKKDYGPCEGSFWLDAEKKSCSKTATRASNLHGRHYSCDTCKKEFMTWKKKNKE